MTFGCQTWKWKCFKAQTSVGQMVELVCGPVSALSDTDREERVGLDLTFKKKKEKKSMNTTVKMHNPRSHLRSW